MTQTSEATIQQFTPGPWMVGHTEGIGQRGVLYVRCSNGTVVADCEAPFSPLHEGKIRIRSQQEDEANARLIAAAPAMYAALVAESEFWYHAFNCPNCEPESATYCDDAGDFDDLLKQRRAAIALAETLTS